MITQEQVADALKKCMAEVDYNFTNVYSDCAYEVIEKSQMKTYGRFHKKESPIKEAVKPYIWDIEWLFVSNHPANVELCFRNARPGVGLGTMIANFRLDELDRGLVVDLCTQIVNAKIEEGA